MKTALRSFSPCKGRLWIGLGTLILAMAAPVRGQEIEDDPTELWLTYQYQSKVGERFRVFGELGYRELVSTERFFGEWTRLQLKAGFSYDVNSRFRIAAGLGVFHTFLPKADDQGEVRLWQDAQIFWPERDGWARRFVLSHRLRLEERFHESQEWRLNSRVRYRVETQIALNSYDIQPGSFFLPLAAEFFVDLGDQAEEVFADRSRVSLGVGYVFNPRWTLDVRYHSQRSRVTVDESFRTIGNVIAFTAKTSVRIRDLVKGQ